MSQNRDQELIELTRSLLDAIQRGDWDAYVELCDPSMTAFEPEARGHLVDGLGFHQFYFEQGGHLGRHENTITAPHVRYLGDDAAVVSYVRLVQRVGESGQTSTGRYEETRVWHRQESRWWHVHFHRSTPDD